MHIIKTNTNDSKQTNISNEHIKSSANIFGDTQLLQLLKAGEDIQNLYKKLANSQLTLAKSHFDVFKGLAIAAEYKDHTSTLHLSRLGYLSEKLCQLLGEPQSYCFMMRLSAPMHDIGKVGVPDSILRKEGSLSADERLIMNDHTIIGEKILKTPNINIFNLASKIAISHHEKFDGSGYPFGLKGKDIHFAGRVVAIVDFFDALTMDRCYRKAIDDAFVYEMVKLRVGTHFDPYIADTFLKNFQSFVEIREKVNLLNLTYENIFTTSVEI